LGVDGDQPNWQLDASSLASYRSSLAAQKRPNSFLRLVPEFQNDASKVEGSNFAALIAPATLISIPAFPSALTPAGRNHS
jgi:hypothetical protein